MGVGVRALVSRRRTKQKYHTIVEFQRRLGKIADEEAESLKLMFSRCRGPEETAEVAKVLECICNPVGDRYAVIMQTEDWFEDDAILCGC